MALVPSCLPRWNSAIIRSCRVNVFSPRAICCSTSLRRRSIVARFIRGALPSRAPRDFRRKKQTPFRAIRLRQGFGATQMREHAVAFDGLPRSPFPLATPRVCHVAEVQQQLHLATKQEGKEIPWSPTTIIHGDCVTGMRNLPPSSVDFVLTDPLILSIIKAGRPTQGGERPQRRLARPAFSQIYRVMKPASFCVSFYGWNRVHLFMAAWRAAGFRAVGHIVFRKRYASSARFLRYEHEVAYLLAKGDVQPPAWPIPDVIEFRYTGNKLHPTQKPVAALAPLINVRRQQQSRERQLSQRQRRLHEHSERSGLQRRWRQQQFREGRHSQRERRSGQHGERSAVQRRRRRKQCREWPPAEH